MELAERLKTPYDVAFARDQAGMLHVALEEPDAVLAHADLLARQAAEQRLPLFAAHGVIQRGWAIARLGRGDDRLAELRRGFELLAETGERLGLGFCLSLLAETLAGCGELAAARATIEDAFAAVPEERHDKPDILRRRGDLMARADGRSAEASYREALALARAHGSLAVERRAASAFAELLVAEGCPVEARAVLAPLLPGSDERQEVARPCGQSPGVEEPH